MSDAARAVFQAHAQDYDAEWSAAAQRMSHDRCATIDDQLAWLRDAGFGDVGCLWRDGRFAVLVARVG